MVPWFSVDGPSPSLVARFFARRERARAVAEPRPFSNPLRRARWERILRSNRPFRPALLTEPPMIPPSEPLFSKSFVRLLMVQPLAGFAVSAFYLLPKFLASELHATAWEIGVVSAAYGVAGALAVPFLATAID